jgi:hypothetical protein
MRWWSDEKRKNGNGAIARGCKDVFLRGVRQMAVGLDRIPRPFLCVDNVIRPFLRELFERSMTRA